LLLNLILLQLRLLCRLWLSLLLDITVQKLHALVVFPELTRQDRM
jgi:hypothetical protein